MYSVICNSRCAGSRHTFRADRSALVASGPSAGHYPIHAAATPLPKAVPDFGIRFAVSVHSGPMAAGGIRRRRRREGEPMRMSQTILPWSGVGASECTDVRDRLAGRLGADSRFLPRRMNIYCDPGVPVSSVEEFMDRASRFLFKEMAVRSARVRRLAGTASFEPGELEALLTGQTFRQNWAIYFAENGGLPLVDSPDESRGVIPCSSM